MSDEQRFPETTLATERLMLRAFGEGDVDDVREACSDELTQRWLPLPRPYTAEVAKEWCAKCAHTVRETGGGITFAAAPRAGDRLVGSFGLTRTDWGTRMTEVGYWVAPWARGQGYAAEAVLGVARWLFSDEYGFERLELKAATGNLASRRVADKAGFVPEGVMRNAGITHAGRVDLVLYSLIPVDLANLADAAGPA